MSLAGGWTYISVQLVAEAEEHATGGGEACGQTRVADTDC